MTYLLTTNISKLCSLHDINKKNTVFLISWLQNVWQVGFNAGDGVQFFKVNVGLTPDVVNIDEMSNVGNPGVFVFGVDKTEVIQPCEGERKNP